MDTAAPTLEDLGLPPVLGTLSRMSAGLVIVAGAARQGKTATLAAMVGHRSAHADGHIMTVERALAHRHGHGRSIVHQCRVGTDVESHEAAVRNAMRVRPDAIAIDGICDARTLECAFELSAMGHLCIATLEAGTTAAALERLVELLPGEDRPAKLYAIASAVRAVILQRRVPAKDGRGAVTAVEITISDDPNFVRASGLAPDGRLSGVDEIAGKLREGTFDEIKAQIAASRSYGMQTVEQHLLALYGSGVIGYDEALRHADVPDEVRLEIELDEGGYPVARA